MLQVIIAGRLTKDAILRYTADGTPVLGFTVATDVGYGEKKHGVFIGCTIWGKRGEALDPHLKKGKQVTCIGEGDLRKWDTNSSVGSEITCKVQEVTMQGGGKVAQSDQSSGSGFRDKPAEKPVTQGEFLDDDIPF